MTTKKQRRVVVRKKARKTTTKKAEKKAPKKLLKASKKRGGKKHDWAALEREYLIGNNPNLTQFLKGKGINPRLGGVQKKTKDWVSKRRKIGEEATQAVEEELKKTITEAEREMMKDAAGVAKNLYKWFVRNIYWRGLTPEQRDKAKAEANETGNPLPGNLNAFELDAALRAVRLSMGLSTEKNDIDFNGKMSFTEFMKQADKENEHGQSETDSSAS